MTITIRATPPETPAVRSLIADLDRHLAELYPPEQCYILDLNALCQSSVTFLAAWDDECAVGCGAVRVMPAAPATGDQRYGEIKRMYVRPAHRGQRIGQRLLEGLEAALRRQGVERALLETGRAQPEALKLYARCGYQERGPYGDYVDDGVSVFMEKQWKIA